MKAVLALALVLLAPLALANQDISAGPATLTTTTFDGGDGCGGANGSHVRDAHATIQIDAQNSLQADAGQSCYDYTDAGHQWESHGNSTFVGVWRQGPSQSYGPAVFYSWTTYHYADAYGGDFENCQSNVYVAGPAVSPGCPSMDGSGAPMVLVLP